MKCVDTKLYPLAEFVLSAEIDNINLYKLLEFCEKSRIAQKVRNSAQVACRYSPGVVYGTV
jgi:hypothetical protein